MSYRKRVIASNEFVLSGAYESESHLKTHSVESIYLNGLVTKYLLPSRVDDVTDIASLAEEILEVFMDKAIPSYDVVVYVNGPRTFIHALLIAWEQYANVVETFEFDVEHGDLILAHWDKVTETYLPEFAPATWADALNCEQP